MLGRGLTPDVAVQIEGQCPSVHVVGLADLQYQTGRNDAGLEKQYDLAYPLLDLMG